jgi:hypothetical protein
MSVLDSEKIVDAIHLIEDVAGDFSQPGSGILFCLPVSRVRGLPGELKAHR